MLRLRKLISILSFYDSRSSLFLVPEEDRDVLTVTTYILLSDNYVLHKRKFHEKCFHFMNTKHTVMKGKRRITE